MRKILQIQAMLWAFFLSAIIVLIISFYSNRLMASSTLLLAQNTHERLSALGTALSSQASRHNIFLTETSYANPGTASALDELFSDFIAKYNAEYIGVLQQKGDSFDVVLYKSSPEAAEIDIDADIASADFQTAISAAYSSGEPTYYDSPITSFGASTFDFALFPQSQESVIAVGVTTSSHAGSLFNMTNLTIAQSLAVVTALTSGFFGFLLYRKKALASEQSNVAKSQFLSRMSHEIRTPMNAIIGLCRIAKEQGAMPEVKKTIGQINVSASHLLILINDILDLSKIESGKLELEAIPICVRAELKSIEESIMPKAQDKHQNLTLRIDPNLPQYIVSDSVHIRQVIMNLLHNAVKFTPEYGDIKLSADLLGQKGLSTHIAVAVEDDGIGIDKKNLDTLFEPFEQGDGSNTRKYGGTGLGLAISKRLAELLGGNLTVTTQVGKGSSFMFDFFADVTDECTEDIGTAGSSGGGILSTVSLAGKTVLVVDDSEVNLIVAESALEDLGCTIEFARNGLEACDLYEADPHRYSIIFMDVQMPVMDGYAATEKIRSLDYDNAKTLPIIAMTANVYKEDIDKARACGMNDHIAKPVEFDQVIEVVRKLQD